MTLDDLKVFLIISESGSLTAAAQRLFVSQPALTKHLAKFEEELGTSLFIRAQGSRKLALTPAGKMLLPFAERWEKLQKEFSMLHDLNSQVHFFITATDSIGEYVLPSVLHAFHQLQPDVELVVRQSRNRDCYSAVHDSTCDLAFVDQEHFYQDIITTPLWQEEMVLLTTNGALQDPVPNELLHWDSEVVIPWNNAFMRWRQEQLAFTRHPAVQLANMRQATAFMMEDRDRWIIAPAGVANTEQFDHFFMHIARLRTPPPPRTVFMIERADRRHPYTGTLIELLKNEAGENPGIRLL